MPLLDYYRARPTFRSVDGNAAPERVADELARVVDSVAGAGASR
jgi:hypothetical protein